LSVNCLLLTVHCLLITEMDQPRQIIHLDLDAFYCAVEEQLDPSLCGLPFAVGRRPDQRGVVSSCSYAARARGVRSAMPMARALQLCPQLKIISPHFAAYHEASRKVMAHLHALTSLVEQLSIDEAFLDVSELPESAESIGRRLQAKIQAETSLPCSLGIATNKLVAKIATDVGKTAKVAQKSGSPPKALTVVPPGQEAQFLAPLPVNMLWGVGRKTAEKLSQMNVHTIGELATFPDSELAKRFGKIGWDLAKRAKGIDNRPIVTEHEVKSISQEVTFAQDVSDGNKLRQTLRRQSERVTQQLHKQGLTARTVKIKIRWPDFTTLTHQITLQSPAADQEVFARTAMQLFEDAWSVGKPVRLLGMGVSNLEQQPRQLGLWDADVSKERHLQEAITELQQRFGDEVIGRGFPEDEE